MISSRKIEDLHPRVAELARKFVAECDRAGIDVLIYSTYRDAESQAALYAQGRQTPGPIVTYAMPGQSFHNWRCAFDFVPMLNGKPAWNDKPLYRMCGEIGERVGLEWAGRWKSFNEMAHLQYTGGLTIKDLQAGKEIA